MGDASQVYRRRTLPKLEWQTLNLKNTTKAKQTNKQTKIKIIMRVTSHKC
jgi:hypothetical protein